MSVEHDRQSVAVFDPEFDKKDRLRLDELDQHHTIYDTLARDWTDDACGT